MPSKSTTKRSWKTWERERGSYNWVRNEGYSLQKHNLCNNSTTDDIINIIRGCWLFDYCQHFSKSAFKGSRQTAQTSKIHNAYQIVSYSWFNLRLHDFIWGWLRVWWLVLVTDLTTGSKHFTTFWNMLTHTVKLLICRGWHRIIHIFVPSVFSIYILMLFSGTLCERHYFLTTQFSAQLVLLTHCTDLEDLEWQASLLTLAWCSAQAVIANYDSYGDQPSTHSNTVLLFYQIFSYKQVCVMQVAYLYNVAATSILLPRRPKHWIYWTPAPLLPVEEQERENFHMEIFILFIYTNMKHQQMPGTALETEPEIWFWLMTNMVIRTRKTKSDRHCDKTRVDCYYISIRERTGERNEKESIQPPVEGKIMKGRTKREASPLDRGR